MTAARARAEQWGVGKLRAFRVLESRSELLSARLEASHVPVHARLAPKANIGRGPVAPAHFPYLDHRTVAEVWAAEGRR